jgi:hypothetical protein
MRIKLPSRILFTAGLGLALVSCGPSDYPPLQPFEVLTPPPPRPPGLVADLQARAMALEAAAATQRAAP